MIGLIIKFLSYTGISWCLRKLGKIDKKQVETKSTKRLSDERK